MKQPGPSFPQQEYWLASTTVAEWVRQWFGLIGALVESAIVHNENDQLQARQRQLTTINKATLDFNIGSKFREKVETTMKPIDWLNVSYVVKKHKIRIYEVEQMVKNADDYSNIKVFSYVAIYANEKNLAKIAKDARPHEDPPTLYKNVFKYEFQFDGTYTTAESALKGWSDNDGEMLKRALSASIDELVNQIVTDFSYTTVSYKGR